MMQRFLKVFVLLAATTILYNGSPLRAQAKDPLPIMLAPHHATISVADMDRESLWFQHVLGFQEVRRAPHGSPDFMVCRLVIPGYRLDLVTQKGSSRPPKEPRGFQQGWMNVVFSTPSIDAFYKHLQALGIEVKVDRDAQSAIEHLTFEDPEGNEIGIAPQ